jgi:hypothetical protein
MLIVASVLVAQQPQDDVRVRLDPARSPVLSLPRRRLMLRGSVSA